MYRFIFKVDIDLKFCCKSYTNLSFCTWDSTDSPSHIIYSHLCILSPYMDRGAFVFICIFTLLYIGILTFL